MRRGVLAMLALCVAVPLAAQPLRQIYKLSFTVTPAADRVTVDVDVTERESGKVIASPKFDAKPGEWSTTTIASGARQIELRVQGKRDGSATLFINVKENGREVQRNLYTYAPDGAQTKECGDGISLELKQADIRDVMRTFAVLSSQTIEVDKDVDTKITVSLRGTPWDEALRKIAREHNLKLVYDGETIRITR
jgi:hypothetical protein